MLDAATGSTGGSGSRVSPSAMALARTRPQSSFLLDDRCRCRRHRDFVTAGARSRGTLATAGTGRTSAKSLDWLDAPPTVTVAASTAAATCRTGTGRLRVRHGSGCGNLDNCIRGARHAVRRQHD